MKTSIEKEQRRREYEAHPFKQPRMRFSAYDRHKWRINRKYHARHLGVPEKRTIRHIDTLGGNYSFELRWGKLAGGSKLRAYRRARQLSASNNGQPCACPMATPKGFLP